MREARRRAGDAHSKNALRAWIQLTKCAKRIEGQINGHFVGEHESSLSRFDVLANLARMPGRAASPTELSRMLLASKGNITRLLDRMEDDGLIRRTPHASDRRVSNVHMTRAGAALFARLVRDHEDWTNSIFSPLDNGELKQLIGLLGKLRLRVEGLAQRTQAPTLPRSSPPSRGRGRERGGASEARAVNT
ncbi:MAG TPA: MarR family transcriptional regulator [Candidatus Binatia bacterium]|nr:MarR family transcriptional regulator [Candidatus Binatia bacterium]